MKGDVIDIGGKKENKRGAFRPPLSQVTSWQYVNLDKSTNPDFCCSADRIPVNDASFDTALLCEVLEHLKEPEKVLGEIFRILKSGGALIISTPFLFPVHANPYDFQRWTDTKIRLVLESFGFSDIRVNPMGGVGAVTHDLLFTSFKKANNKYCRLFGRIGLRLIKPIFNVLEKMLRSTEKVITTGYFVTAKK
jgi:SAM-dependent methyltransferase